MLCLLQSMRPKQWPKNLLVFAGLIFTLNDKHPASDILKVVAAFVLFCLLSGAVYLLNDVMDAEKDRNHPKKRNRPIACGDLSSRVALVFSATLAAGSLYASFCLNLNFGISAAVYVAAAALYSLVLKHVVIVDVLTIAAGFVVRAIAGALVIGVSISEWLLVCTTLLALFLGLAKRRNELIVLDKNAIDHRKILREYTPELLDQMLMITASCSIMAYMLYTFLSRTGLGHRYMMATIPFVIYGLFRYLYLVHTRNLGGSPESVVLEDKPLIASILLWMGAVMTVFLLAPK
ncbi:MAG: decaprenyl-phosphate phosphoribosyltransferase [Armatimonadota bacterium]|nr:decaprenyl-phosphate phosphoribosyltransferase [Armatimonadota bacterium]